MAKTPKEVEGDPRRGDQVLKRMLQTEPKTHEEMVRERRSGKRKAPKKK